VDGGTAEPPTQLKQKGKNFPAPKFLPFCERTNPADFWTKYNYMILKVITPVNKNATYSIVDNE
jgi:hypothetical protein